MCLLNSCCAAGFTYTKRYLQAVIIEWNIRKAKVDTWVRV